MKILVISDTHCLHNKLVFTDENNKLKEEYKDIDTIIHCGDMTNSKRDNDIELHLFLGWYNDLPFKNKILIAGNHDTFLEKLDKNKKSVMFKQFYREIIYLEDNEVIIDKIKFYGSPWTPTFMNWAFMTSENKLAEIYSKIPSDVDVLITHGPAYSILDETDSHLLVGSTSLKERINMLSNLKYHLFGHIHEDKGISELKNYTAVNASIFNYHTKDFSKFFVIEV